MGMAVTVTVGETAVERVLCKARIGLICHGTVMKPDYSLLIAHLVMVARGWCHRIDC